MYIILTSNIDLLSDTLVVDVFSAPGAVTFTRDGIENTSGRALYFGTDTRARPPVKYLWPWARPGSAAGTLSIASLCKGRPPVAECF